MNIVVLAGGFSHERDVSMSSGSQIANALMTNGHKVLLLDLYIGIKEASTFQEAYAIAGSSHYEYVVPDTEPDLEKLKRAQGNQKELVGPNVINICQSADFCFLGLHGGIGENGQLQALFDIYGIRYTGSGYKGSLIAMDKQLSKQVMIMNHVQTPDAIVVESEKDIDFPLPCVVKPIDNGSSIGVTIVETQEELEEAVLTAKKYSNKVLLEQKINGREFSVGVLAKDALPPIEIIPQAGFYDYANKYQAGATIEETPARIPRGLTKEMQQMALKVHRILGLSVYSRADFIVDETDNKIYCIEANNLPGMTPTSLLPQEAQALGMKYEELCEQILEFSRDEKK